MYITSTLAAVAGRFLLGAYFLKAGIANTYRWPCTLALMRAKNMPLAPLFLVGAIVIEIFGSLCLIFNYYAAYGALALILFTLLANFLFCNYWSVSTPGRQMVSFLFYSHWAVIGGLLLVLAMS